MKTICYRNVSPYFKFLMTKQVSELFTRKKLKDLKNSNMSFLLIKLLL
jgi:hypothetical protein